MHEAGSALGRGLPEHPQGFDTIEAFCNWAHANHVRVLATFPNMCDEPDYHGPVAQRSARIITDFFARLGVPVIGEYTDALLSQEDFLDTKYHLPRKLRSPEPRLIPKLRAALE